MTQLESVQTQPAPAVVTPEGLLAHWQGHRRLTRKVIEAFPSTPKDQLFEFSIGGMRPFGVMAWELQQVSALTLRGLLTGEWTTPEWRDGVSSNRNELLSAWDDLTADRKSVV